MEKKKETTNVSNDKFSKHKTSLQQCFYVNKNIKSYSVRILYTLWA